MKLVKPKINCVYMYGCILRPHVNPLRMAMYLGMKLAIDITCIVYNMWYKATKIY